MNHISRRNASGFVSRTKASLQSLFVRSPFTHLHEIHVTRVYSFWKIIDLSCADCDQERYQVEHHIAEGVAESIWSSIHKSKFELDLLLMNLILSWRFNPSGTNTSWYELEFHSFWISFEIFELYLNSVSDHDTAPWSLYAERRSFPWSSTQFLALLCQQLIKILGIEVILRIWIRSTICPYLIEVWCTTSMSLWDRIRCIDFSNAPSWLWFCYSNNRISYIDIGSYHIDKHIMCLCHVHHCEINHRCII